VLGGKCTGKSFLLREIERTYPDNVYIVNMRLHNTIVGGLLSALNSKISSDKVNKTIVNKVKDIFTNLWNNSNLNVKFGNVIDIDLLVNSKEVDSLSLEMVVNCIVSSLGNISIVIDEATIPFTIINNDPVEIKACRETLALFTQITKETNQLNVFLISSEYSFPFRLKNIGFKLKDIKSNIYAGELSPAEIYKLLTNEWGVGPNLSKALVSLLGGHIYKIYVALEKLSQNLKYFRGTITAGQVSDIQSCIRLSQRDENMKMKMVETLTLLAVKGFVPTEGDVYCDPIEEIISEYNVGGIVTKDSYIQGLPDEIWDNPKSKTGLVPSSQSIRLAIAEVLVNANYMD